MRAQPLLNLLNSVRIQSVYPDEIIIVDGSTNDATQEVLENNQFRFLNYYKVDAFNRGLTKQRNFGIEKVNSEMNIVCFLDDDIVLESDYFENLIATYELFPDALGVGGTIINESTWEFIDENYIPKITEFYYDCWKKKDGIRFVIRKIFGLDSDKLPGFMPDFSHGRSLGFIPPTDKIYKVEQLMGGVSSFKKSVFSTFKFSTYFEGYGLYEDADFTLRVSKTGALYLNTKAKLNHYHDSSGRPNQYQYGKMVVRNGWYVWRVKYPKPTLKARLKWNLTSFLLTLVRFSNTFTTANKKEAFTESVGRTIGWFSLLFNKPKIQQ
jgi:glycosyltransferase involved in cell wall biosynthesis